MIIGGWVEGFFYGTRTQPTQQIQHRPRFIVGATGSSTSKRLLAHHGTGGSVIDIKIAGCMAQSIGCPIDGRTILG